MTNRELIACGWTKMSEIMRPSTMNTRDGYVSLKKGYQYELLYNNMVYRLCTFPGEKEIHIYSYPFNEFKEPKDIYHDEIGDGALSTVMLLLKINFQCYS